MYWRVELSFFTGRTSALTGRFSDDTKEDEETKTKRRRRKKGVDGGEEDMGPESQMVRSLRSGVFVNL